MKLASFPGDVHEEVSGKRSREEGNERRERWEGGEGGWLMRIESWGRFSVYVARIRNFGASNHIQYLGLRLSTHTHVYTPPRMYRPERGKARRKKWIRIFDLQFCGSWSRRHICDVSNWKIPQRYPQKALKIQIQPARQRTVKIIHMLSRAMYSDGSECGWNFTERIDLQIANCLTHIN